MKINNIKTKVIIIIFLPVQILLFYILSFFPNEVEHIYSNGINKYVRGFLSNLFGILPFSAAELIIVISSILGILYIVRTIIKVVLSNSKKNIILIFLVNLFSFISIVYFAFMCVWGINYERLPFSAIAKLDVHPGTVAELGELCNSLINMSNSLYEKQLQAKTAVRARDEYKRDILSRVNTSYINASRSYSFNVLNGKYGNPKGIFLSVPMSYTGISGIYFPFTGEPNVNMDIPSWMLPSTACHEAAHQRGFAREDEANYISYLVCSNSGYIDFQYSGSLLALIYSMNTLYAYDINKYNNLKTKYSEGVKRDLLELNKYWDKYEGPVEKLSNKVNNLYLKANRQRNGVYSYGRMVDLLLAKQRLETKQ